MTAATGAGVEVRNVSKSFGVDGARVTVLDDVSLTIGMGEFVSVIGPSGCGKSTLLKVVAGLLDADSGTVAIDGEAVTDR
ncbi:MAG: ATP-binding cassette domain-containing protein, partial [Microbacterium sp.]|nr:ATP-binding cassette domain-containing protein [Microbacterium sp.]